MAVIAQDQYVRLEYRLRLASGEYIRGSSEAPAELVFIAGCQELLPGLERRLWGAREQDDLEFVLPAAEAFGRYDPEQTQEWSRQRFSPGLELKPGMAAVRADSPFPQEYPLIIKEVREDSVLLDLNHPLAGKDLHYHIRVVEVRPATEEELAPVQKCRSCQEQMEQMP